MNILLKILNTLFSFYFNLMKMKQNSGSFLNGELLEPSKDRFRLLLNNEVTNQNVLDEKGSLGKGHVTMYMLCIFLLLPIQLLAPFSVNFITNQMKQLEGMAFIISVFASSALVISIDLLVSLVLCLFVRNLLWKNNQDVILERFVTPRFMEKNYLTDDTIDLVNNAVRIFHKVYNDRKVVHWNKIASVSCIMSILFLASSYTLTAPRIPLIPSLWCIVCILGFFYVMTGIFCIIFSIKASNRTSQLIKTNKQALYGEE